MAHLPRFFGIYAAPSRPMNWMLAALPFLVLILVYLQASAHRLQANPQDKLLPSVTKMIDAIDRMALTPDKRSGSYLMGQDTFASLRRLAIGTAISAVAGLLVGLNIGMFPGLRSVLLAFVTFISIIPPLAILPILFISFGVGELAKIMLICIGICPLMTRDIVQAVQQIPREQITKAMTLGASQLQVVYRVVLPQIMPRLIDVVRLSLGAAWLFLIASEAIASSDGLGYRIFLVRRYLAMDVIIPYVMWITFLGFVLDGLLRGVVSWRYAWYRVAKE